MILQTPILALLLVAVLASVVALWSAGFAVRVARQWDLASGSQAQLRMERMTQLVSTLFGAVMLTEIAALFLFVFNADRMAAFFVGAMCAVGTLNVNVWGFPALYLKIAVFFAATLWLVIDHVDRHAPDYPLTRVKYLGLIAIVPLVLADAIVELVYFSGLKTDVITSCCSKMFTPSNSGVAAEMTGVAPALALWVLAVSGVAAALTGGVSLRWRGAIPAFAISGAILFGAALTAVVSVISLYVYDHPNHHCPFCLLQPEYGYFGYFLYIPLFAGAAFALSAGLLSAVKNAPSLIRIVPAIQIRLVIAALVGFGLFGAVSCYAIITSQLILFG